MRFFDRSLLVAIAAAAALGLPLGALAQESQKPADAAQIEQLQKQLAAMQEEMKGLQKALEEKDVPAGTRATMGQHMGRMKEQMQSMHQSCCMMNPAGCQHTGMGMGMQSPGSTR